MGRWARRPPDRGIYIQRESNPISITNVACN